MNETVQNYVDRILGYTQGQEPLKVQAATASALARLVKGVSPAKLRKRSAPEQWSVVEILAHLADSEIVCGWRLRAIQAPLEIQSRRMTRTHGRPLDTM